MLQTASKEILDIRIGDDVIEKLQMVKEILMEIQELKTKNEAPKKILRIDDVVKRYGISRNSASEIFKAEDSPGYRIGQQWFIEEDEMVVYLKRKTEKYREDTA